ncbi:hypothetical protein ACOMHN_050087 [Nucella lapillus]
MFSEWVVEVLKLVLPRFQPARARFAFPARFFADVLFAIFVFLCLNRRLLFRYRPSFWGQLLYIVQLFKVVFTLRFLLMELVFRELRTFFCFIRPVISKVSIMKQWQAADPCVLKVVNLAFFLVFMGLNFLIAYSIEKVLRWAWKCLKDSKRRKRLILYLRNPMDVEQLDDRPNFVWPIRSPPIPHPRPIKKRRRKRRRFSVPRRPTRPTPPKGIVLEMWPVSRSAASASRSSLKSEEDPVTDTADSSTSGDSEDYVMRRTRSGKEY